MIIPQIQIVTREIHKSVDKNRKIVDNKSGDNDDTD